MFDMSMSLKWIGLHDPGKGRDRDLDVSRFGLGERLRLDRRNSDPKSGVTEKVKES